MKRLLTSGLFAVLSLFAAACHADPGAAYTEGKNYHLAAMPQKPDDPKRITVEEFFWYGCPHCYHFEPEVEAWLKAKPADVSFERVPNTLGRPIGELHERAFYIAQALGILDKTHKPLFDAIHTQGFPMSTLESIRDLYMDKGGITAAQFDAMAHSFVVESNMRRADDLAVAYGITGTPTFVVGGKYVVDAQPDALKVVDFVIAKVRKERK